MAKIKKGDKVIVIAGKDKGKQSTIQSVLGDKVIVEGVNVAKRHQKPNPMRGVEGGIVVKNMPMAISNVALFNPETKKADRVGFKLEVVDGKTKRVRVFKSTGAAIDA